MGDMLVKSGDWRTGQKLYANAKLSPAYAGWRYAPVLEERIAHAERNVSLLREDRPPGDTGGLRMMVSSTHSCMACHQR